MTKDQAHELLDTAKGGALIPQADIMRALRATGDLGLSRGMRTRTLAAANALLLYQIANPHLQAWARQIVRANTQFDASQIGGNAG